MNFPHFRARTLATLCVTVAEMTCVNSFGWREWGGKADSDFRSPAPGGGRKRWGGGGDERRLCGPQRVPRDTIDTTAYTHNKNITLHKIVYPSILIFSRVKWLGVRGIGAFQILNSKGKGKSSKSHYVGKTRATKLYYQNLKCNHWYVQSDSHKTAF